MKTTDTTTVKRRAFLKGAAVTTVAVGSGALTASAVAESESARTKKPDKGYHESPHIKDYYRLARF